MSALSTPAPEIGRDRYGRPLVIPPKGGKAIPYTRCTTFVGCLEDTYNLSLWQQRMVALGLNQRPDLMLAVSAHGDDKAKLNKICEDAKEAAAAHAAATTGTALHALTERVDRGQELGVIPEAYQADIAAYEKATADLTATHIEQFSVLDNLQIGGTPDRIVKFNDGSGVKRYIADVKTGSIEYGILKIAMQLAVYARSAVYDIVTGERSTHGAEVDKGLIIWLPAGEGRCELVWVDLLAGWDAVRTARDIREKRKLKFKDLTTPFATEPPVPAEPESPSLQDQIKACETADAVRALWTPDWTDDLNDLARQHIATMQVAS